MIDPTVSLKDSRNNSSNETANVLAHKKKLAPISLASQPNTQTHAYSDVANEMGNLNISNQMDISMQSNNSQAMSIQSEYNPNGSKMSIQSMNSDLNKTKTSHAEDTFKVPNPKNVGDKGGASSSQGTSGGEKGKVQDFLKDEEISSKNKMDLRYEDLKNLKLMGKGSQGSVFKTLHVPSNTILAVKDLNYNTDETFHKQLKLELATLRNCDCDYIVRCYGAFYRQGVISIALEFMDIGCLTDIIQKLNNDPTKPPQGISEVMLGAITYQVLKGLEYLHKNMKVIHRDIKPSNLLINSEGEIKIADFGVSGKIENTTDFRDTWVGTAIYMSPERFSGEKYNFDTDIWSLGLTIVECALGRYPYSDPGTKQALTFFDILEAINSKPAPTLPESFSNDIKDFVSICLRKEPGTRSSAPELLKHPFVKKYAKVSTNIFKDWLKTVV